MARSDASAALGTKEQDVLNQADIDGFLQAIGANGRPHHASPEDYYRWANEYAREAAEATGVRKHTIFNSFMSGYKRAMNT